MCVCKEGGGFMRETENDIDEHAVQFGAVFGCVLRCVAVCGCVLQCVAGCCSVLQCVAVCLDVVDVPLNIRLLVLSV